ncbi:MAG: Holliday junction branch migration protein RuvA [Hormoscilla sp. GUM202]|nr:Holliday junction branch migration protein RuvA [Hormoscilla sp. GUM202]
MISYLCGTVAQVQKTTANRVILILEVNQIGYEVQIGKGLAASLSERSARGRSEKSDERVQIFTHLQVRSEQPVLYGFASGAERDLFRQLVSVSGIGAQLAIALLDTLGLADLLQAIVTGNVKQLAKTPGVGSKIAERISLELRNKLAEWRTLADIPIPGSAALAPELQEDVEITLLALGYTIEEVGQALQALSQDPRLQKSQDAETWIKEAIAWLT